VGATDCGATRRNEYTDGRFETIGEGGKGVSVVADPFEVRDVVEPALARAPVLAAEAGRWELVDLIAAELATRRSRNQVGCDDALLTRATTRDRLTRHRW
jgi:hypothetical protein